MYDIKWIREFPQEFDSGMKKRGIDIKSDTILQLDGKICEKKTILQNLQSQKNRHSRFVGQADNIDESLLKEERKRGEELKSNIEALEKSLRDYETELKRILENLPNIPTPDVPYGLNENDNIILRTSDIAIRDFSFSAKHHYELEDHGIDFANGRKLSGSRFVILHKDLALMERALANFMLDQHIANYGYQEVSTPVLVKDETMFGVGQLPKFADDSFAVSGGYRLIPTAEVTLTSLVANSIISQELLPLRYTAHTNCFRSEAGSAGKDTRGMIRLHQFNKVELVSITTPKESAEEHERMLAAAENILQKLDLPYRVVLLSSQDMGFCAAKTYDLEVWLPGQKQYREISSCSNCKSFQSIRMRGKYKDGENKKYYLHTLNGSGLAIGRTIVAIMENYQQENGDIDIPQLLQPYMKGMKKITSKKK